MQVSIAVFLAVGLTVLAGPLAQERRGGEWPAWRGPLANGAAPRGDPPVSWSEGQNVRWKTALPGKGHSTPIVWGDRVYLTAAVPYGEILPGGDTDADGAHDNVPAAQRMHFVVLAIDRASGTIAWQRTVRSERPHDSTHETGSWASASPVTDGERVYAFFGSAGLYGLDLQGRVLWEKDFGDMHPLHGHGEGSSPALDGHTLVVNWDQEGESFVVALDSRTGEQLWKVARDEGTSWSTPLVVEHEGRKQVVISATKRIRSYDLRTGELLWACGGLSHNVVASPVAAGGLVYAGSSYETRALLAIRLAGARGDVTGSPAVAWTRDRDTPYVPSPVVDGTALCFVKHIQGFLTCVDAASGGTLVGPERLEGLDMVFASPVVAAGRIYVAGRNGSTVVLRRGERLEVLARNVLDDAFSASPAIAGDELYLRGERFLYCLAKASG